MKQPDEERAMAMAEEMSRLRNNKIELSIDYWTGFCLIGVLQMFFMTKHDSRHTEHKLISFAHLLTTAFELAPVCKSVIEEGWKQVDENRPS